MNVGDLFQDLSFGELRNLYLGGEGTGSIIEGDQPRIIYYTNRALTHLFSRFTVKRTFVNLVAVGGRSVYHILPKHAVSDTDPGNAAIRFLEDDLEDPFESGLIKIMSATLLPCEDFPDGLSLVFNASTEGIELTLLAYDKLKFENLKPGMIVSLELQMDHPRLVIPVNEDQEILVPPMLIEALHAKVAAGIFSSMNGEENIGKANIKEAQFEMFAQIIEMKDLTQSSMQDDAASITLKGFR